MKTKYFYLLPAALLLFSCEEEQQPVDDRKPGIQLQKPATSDKVFSKGDTLEIQGMVSDNQRLKEIHVDIKAGSTGVMHYILTPDVGIATLDTSYIFTDVTDTTTYSLYIKAVDFTLNESDLTREFTVLP